ncbi:hypothetical protein DSO57_1028750, partial [Entomophthora muscae]
NGIILSGYFRHSNRNSANHKPTGLNGHGNGNNGQPNRTHFCVTATQGNQDEEKAWGEH